MNDPSDLLVNASLLIVEIGNSHINVATSIHDQVRTNERFELNGVDDAVEYAAKAWDALPDDRVRSIAAASVVPNVLQQLRERISDRLDSPVLAVGAELHRPMSLAVEAPEQVGIDRICSAAAAYETIQKACVVASFGTAVTIDCVNDEGVFMGGAILPGVKMQAKALHEGTAALPLIEVGDPHDVYGSNTEQAICNGVIYGLVGALRDITERYATQLHAWPELTVTGGNAELICRHCDFVDHLVLNLCVRGIALAHRKHFAPFAEDK